MKQHQRIISGFLAIFMVFSMLPVHVLAEETEHTHNYVLFKSGEATCTESGGSFYLCFACGDSYVENEVDALGHDYVNHCCTRCGETDPDAAVSDMCGDNLEWTFNAETGELMISGSGSMYDFDRDGESVPWRHVREQITSVVLEPGITTIGNAAFTECHNLVSVSIPDSVNRIGSYAFCGCYALTSVVIPEAVETIEYYTFSGCFALEEVTLPDSITTIARGAFGDTYALETIAIPQNVSYIGPFAFGMSNISTIYFEGDAPTFDSADSEVFFQCYLTAYYPAGNTTWNGVEDLTSSLIGSSGGEIVWTAYPNGDSHDHSYNSTITAPDCIQQGYTTYECACGDTYISDYKDALGHDYQNGVCTRCDEIDPDYIGGSCGDNLTWVLYEDGTLVISGTGEMDNSVSVQPWTRYEIKNVVIQMGVTSISDGAFYECKSVATIAIPSSVTLIGKYAFQYCESLTSIDIPHSVTSIGSFAFEGCKKLTKITIPGSVTDISCGAFAQCRNLNEVTIMDGVTQIGDYAFDSCVNLTRITIPGSITSIGDYAFSYCHNLTAFTVPEGISNIGTRAFVACSGLTTVNIPKSVTKIGHEAFYNCSNLTSVYFYGDAPEFGNILFGYDSIYDKICATAYYPAGNITWTEDVMQDYGGDITWVPYNPEDGWGEDEDLHDTLAELKDEDYLAFAAIAYEEFGESGSVKSNLAKKWNTEWNERLGITYAELCKNIANWEVLNTYDLSNYNGFYAVPFTNDAGEVVIAYRGSVPPEQWGDMSWDAFCDWMLNDLPFELGNTMGIQLNDALEIYNFVASDIDISKIRVTGHSLGGAWADAVSAYSGCKGITFNAVSILDVLYKSEPEKMGQIFAGVDQWNFVDHTNQYDVLAGMFEEFLSTPMKPYKAHKSNIVVEDNVIWALVGEVAGFFAGGPLGAVAGSVVGGVGISIAQCHGLDSILTRDSNGELKLTEVDSVFTPTYAITNYMLTANHSVDFGSSTANKIEKVGTFVTPRTAYGGDGNDVIVTSIQDDTLIGGNGIDELDGSWGDDTYIYYWGNGSDLIYDVSGDDKLILYGVDSGAKVSFNEPDDSGYVDVFCNGSLVATLATQNRASADNMFTVEWDGVNTTLTSYLVSKKYSSRVDIRCPVEIDIVDAEGNVVYTIKDGEPGNFYTDYGNFYVYEEEDGGYGKALDLVEGYSVKIVGVDTGTMDISYQDVVNGELGEAKTVTDIPVTDTYEAELEITESGEIELIPVPEHVHEWNEGVVTIEPGCETDGVRTYTCKTDNTHTYTEAVEATGHTEVIDKAVAATCTTTGLTEGKHCSTCGTVLIAQDTIKALGHKETVDKSVAATCVSVGKTEGKHCSVCGEILLAQNDVAKLGHDYKETVMEPTCTTTGKTTFTCTRCNDEYFTTAPALGHTEVVDKAAAATCTAAGKTEGKHCSVCNAVLVEQETIAALGHKWTAADCDTPKTCSVCKATEGKALGHSYDDNVDGTCNSCGVNRETVEVRQVTHMLRMYNPYTGEHFYTGSEEERDNLVAVGWNYEGVAFTFPGNTGAPVYRLYDPDTGEHLYTMDEEEKASLMAADWNYEGIAFNSAYDTEAVQHRLHNPYATVGAYHFTFSEEEKQNLIDAGWEYQGIGWYSCWK